MNLNINYAATKTAGENVVRNAEEFQGLLTEIQNANAQLKSYWVGDDATKYLGAVEEQAEHMKKLSVTINEIGEFLISVSRAYQEAMERNKDAIKG